VEKAGQDEAKKQTFGEQFRDKTGLAQIGSGRSKLKEFRQQESELAELQAKREKAYKRGWKKNEEPTKYKDGEAARAEYDKLGKEIDELQNK
jgi:hypothetical protein